MSHEPLPLEGRVQKENFLKASYRNEWQTMPQHLTAYVVAIGASAGAAYFAKQHIADDKVVTTISRTADWLAYWGTFVPLMLRRERDSLKDESGKYDAKKCKTKAIETLTFMGATDAVYFAATWPAQYIMQRAGYDPVTASSAVTAIAGGSFTVLLPPLRHGWKSLFGTARRASPEDNS